MNRDNFCDYHFQNICYAKFEKVLFTHERFNDFRVPQLVLLFFAFDLSSK